jgi:hypothetical protein
MQKKWNLKIDGYIDNKMYGMMIGNNNFYWSIIGEKN